MAPQDRDKRLAGDIDPGPGRRLVAGILLLMAAALLVAVAWGAIGALLVLAGYWMPGVPVDPEVVSPRQVLFAGTVAVAILTAVAVRALFAGKPPTDVMDTEMPSRYRGVDDGMAHPEYQHQGARCLDDGTIEVYVDDRYLILPSPVDARYLAERLNAAAGLSAMLTDPNPDRRGLLTRMPWSSRKSKPGSGLDF